MAGWQVMVSGRDTETVSFAWCRKLGVTAVITTMRSHGLSMVRSYPVYCFCSISGTSESNDMIVPSLSQSITRRANIETFVSLLRSRWCMMSDFSILESHPESRLPIPGSIRRKGLAFCQVRYRVRVEVSCDQVEPMTPASFCCNTLY